MLTNLTAAVLLLGSVALCSCHYCDSCDPPAVAGTGIVAGLAAACAEGVRRAIQQEVWAAVNNSGEAPEIDVRMSGLLGQFQQTPPPPAECPPGWSRHEDSCYMIPPEKSNWYRAHHACAVLHPRSKLASVHPSSGQFIETMVASSGAETAVWVGLFGSGKAVGNWVWSDGSPFDYAHWDRNQPDGGDPSCIHLGWPGYTNNLWHDNGCGVVVNVLCQINLGK